MTQTKCCLTCKAQRTSILPGDRLIYLSAHEKLIVQRGQASLTWSNGKPHRRLRLNLFVFPELAGTLGDVAKLSTTTFRNGPLLFEAAFDRTAPNGFFTSDGTATELMLDDQLSYNHGDEELWVTRDGKPLLWSNRTDHRKIALISGNDFAELAVTIGDAGGLSIGTLRLDGPWEYVVRFQHPMTVGAS